MLKSLVILIFLLPLHLFAINQPGRLGLGLSGQLQNDIPALSIKVMQSRSFAISGLFGISSDEQDGGMGAGVKLYKIFFEEPQLNFYGGLLGAFVREKAGTVDHSGFQFDLTFGSEFSFQGLNSLGFSVDFGLSMNKMDEFVVETVGKHFFSAAVHFYL